MVLVSAFVDSALGSYRVAYIFSSYFTLVHFPNPTLHYVLAHKI